MADVLRITAALATITTLLLLILATPLAWWFARGGFWGKELVAAATSLPLVLPPTVLGFYLLIAISPHSVLMIPFHAFGIRTLAFTFWGLVIGSVFYSLPFAIQPLRTAFEGVGRDQLEAAKTLGASSFDTFTMIAAPLARRGFLAAAVLVFAHTIGEFGVVLMIGGSIPGQTEVASIHIFHLIESLRYDEAHVLAAGLAAFSFLSLLTLYLLDRRFAQLSY